MLGRSSVSDLSEHVFDLIQELFAIDPQLLLSVMPQLEFKLKVFFKVYREKKIYFEDVFSLIIWE